MTEHWFYIILTSAVFPWLLLVILAVFELRRRKRERVRLRRKHRHAGHRRHRDGRDRG